MQRCKIIHTSVSYRVPEVAYRPQKLLVEHYWIQHITNTWIV